MSVSSGGRTGLLVGTEELLSGAAGFGFFRCADRSRDGILLFLDTGVGERSGVSVLLLFEAVSPNGAGAASVVSFTVPRLSRLSSRERFDVRVLLPLEET